MEIPCHLVLLGATVLLVLDARGTTYVPSVRIDGWLTQ